MKKLLWLLLLFPIIVNAKTNINAQIECQEELTIGDNINCKLVINNPEKLLIKDINFEKQDLLLDIKSEYKINLEENLYMLELNSDNEKIELFSFNYLMDKNNSKILIEEIKVNSEEEEIIQNISKSLAIKNIAYADKIYINNIPVDNMNRDIFSYKVNIYERTEYLEIKTITNGSNTAVDGETILVKYNPNITIKVANDFDTETYNIELNYRNPSNIDTINIKEIPFKFIPNKRNYYIEVENNVDKITMSNSTSSKEFVLTVGANYIYFENSDETYNFIIKRLKNSEEINNDSSLKTLRFGNIYLNLKNGVYDYNYVAENIEVVTVETNKNQDYEIKYSSNKIRVIVYDAELNTSEYTINLINEIEPKKEVKEYDNSKTIIVFIVFLLLFLLLLLFMIKKYKKEHADD